MMASLSLVDFFLPTGIQLLSTPASCDSFGEASPEGNFPPVEQETNMGQTLGLEDELPCGKDHFQGAYVNFKEDNGNSCFSGLITLAA